MVDLRSCSRFNNIEGMFCTDIRCNIRNGSFRDSLKAVEVSSEEFLDDNPKVMEGFD